MEKWFQNKITIILVVVVAIFGGLIFGANQISRAAFNPELNYQGKLTDSTGVAVADATRDMVFKLYAAAGGGIAIWTESWIASALFTDTNITFTKSDATNCGGDDKVAYTNNTNENTLAAGQYLWDTNKKESAVIKSVDTTNNFICVYSTFSTWSNGDTVTNQIYTKSGLFSTMLGTLTSLASIDFGQTLWLGVTVGSDSEMIPRKKLGAAPAAFDADKLDNLDSTQFLRSDVADNADGLITFDALPTGTGVSQGSIYINPVNATAGWTLFGAAVNGTQKFLVDSSGNVTAAGTLSTASTTISGLTSGSVLFAGVSGVIAQNNANFFWDNTNNRLGIGTTQASSTLHVVGTAITTATTTLATLGGKVGIGTIAPSAKLDIVGGILALDNGDWTGNRGIRFRNSADVSAPTGGGIYQGSNDNLYIQMGAAGFINIRDTSGTAQFAFNSNPDFMIKAGGRIRPQDTDSTTSLQIATYSTNTPYVTFDSTNKRVGIGTTQPGTLLTVADSSPIASSSAIQFGTTDPLRMWRSATSAFTISAVTSASTTNLIIGDGGANSKITFGVQDPLYSIDNLLYATYGPSMLGLKEEVAGNAKLLPSLEEGLFAYVIDFNKTKKGSDLWVFKRVTDFGEKMDLLSVLLSAEDGAKVSYKKDPANNRLIIFGDKPLEVSWRLSAPRFDWRNWPTDQGKEYQGIGIVVSSSTENSNYALTSGSASSDASLFSQLKGFLTGTAGGFEDFLAAIGGTIKDGVLSLRQLVVDKLFARTARVGGLEMVDKATGKIWCAQIENGIWSLVQGECVSASSTSSALAPAAAPDGAAAGGAESGVTITGDIISLGTATSTPTATTTTTSTITTTSIATSTTSGVASENATTTAAGVSTTSSTQSPTVNDSQSTSTSAAQPAGADQASSTPSG